MDSDEQFEADIQKAINDYYSREGELAGSWVLVSEGLSPESARTYKFNEPDGQTMVQSAGLIAYARKTSELQLEYWIMNDEED